MFPLSHHPPLSSGETRSGSRFPFRNFTKLPSKKAQEIFMNQIRLKLVHSLLELAILEILLWSLQKENQIIHYYHRLYIHLQSIFKTHVFYILYWKFSLSFYLNLKLRKYLLSKWCSTLESTIEFELEYIRSLYSTFDICDMELYLHDLQLTSSTKWK